MFYIVIRLVFTISHHKIGRGLTAQHIVVREKLALFFLYTEGERRYKTLSESIESSIFFPTVSVAKF